VHTAGQAPFASTNDYFVVLDNAHPKGTLEISGNTDALEGIKDSSISFVEVNYNDHTGALKTISAGNIKFKNYDTNDNVNGSGTEPDGKIVDFSISFGNLPNLTKTIDSNDFEDSESLFVVKENTSLEGIARSIKLGETDGSTDYIILPINPFGGTVDSKSQSFVYNSTTSSGEHYININTNGFVSIVDGDYYLSENPNNSSNFTQNPLDTSLVWSRNDGVDGKIKYQDGFWVVSINNKNYIWTGNTEQQQIDGFYIYGRWRANLVAYTEGYISEADWSFNMNVGDNIGTLLQNTVNVSTHYVYLHSNTETPLVDNAKIKITPVGLISKFKDIYENSTVLTDNISMTSVGKILYEQDDLEFQDDSNTIKYLYSSKNIFFSGTLDYSNSGIAGKPIGDYEITSRGSGFDGVTTPVISGTFKRVTDPNIQNAYTELNRSDEGLGAVGFDSTGMFLGEIRELNLIDGGQNYTSSSIVEFKRTSDPVESLTINTGGIIPVIDGKYTVTSNINNIELKDITSPEVSGAIELLHENGNLRLESANSSTWRIVDTVSNRSIVTSTFNDGIVADTGNYNDSNYNDIFRTWRAEGHGYSNPYHDELKHTSIDNIVILEPATFTFKVNSVDNGIITGVSINNGGKDFVADAEMQVQDENRAKIPTTVKITDLDNAHIEKVELVDPGSGYSNGDNTVVSIKDAVTNETVLIQTDNDYGNTNESILCILEKLDNILKGN
jgi:hypothetical protein